MYQNDYGNCVESWKVRLIARRARRWGIASHDLDEVRQQIVLQLQNFRFDPNHGRGATETTAVVALIDHHLLTACRSASRYRKHLAELREERGRQMAASADTQGDTNHERDVALGIDVQDALAGLSESERQVCLALSDGQSTEKIACALGWSWHRVNRCIGRIRAHFESVGLDGWIRK